MKFTKQCRSKSLYFSIELTYSLIVVATFFPIWVSIERGTFFVMKNRLLAAGIISLLTLSSCERQNFSTQTDGTQDTSIDFFIFGHTGSFCLDCDAVYKIQDGKLYGANHQIISNPDSVQLNLCPNASYELVSGLPSEIPPQLLEVTSLK
jgi:hypothetical protein